jgi:hypothetical protein
MRGPSSWISDAGLISNPSVFVLEETAGAAKVDAGASYGRRWRRAWELPLIAGILKPDYVDMIHLGGQSSPALGRGREHEHQSRRSERSCPGGASEVGAFESWPAKIDRRGAAPDRLRRYGEFFAKGASTDSQEESIIDRALNAMRTATAFRRHFPA